MTTNRLVARIRWEISVLGKRLAKSRITMFWVWRQTEAETSGCSSCHGRTVAIHSFCGTEPFQAFSMVEPTTELQEASERLLQRFGLPGEQVVVSPQAVQLHEFGPTQLHCPALLLVTNFQVIIVRCVDAFLFSFSSFCSSRILATQEVPSRHSGVSRREAVSCVSSSFPISSEN